MDNPGKNKRNRSLDTTHMQEMLKGDSFPQDWEDFLDDDIRNFFDILLNETGMKKSEIIRRANLSRVYGYQLMEGRRRGKRDYYILIALAMSLDLKNTQRMLSVTHCGALHPLIKRGVSFPAGKVIPFESQTRCHFCPLGSWGRVKVCSSQWALIRT